MDRERIAEVVFHYMTLLKQRDDYSPAMVEPELTSAIIDLIPQLGYIRPEPSPDRVEAVVKVIKEKLIDKMWAEPEPDNVCDRCDIESTSWQRAYAEESINETARSILALSPPELTELGEDKYIMISAVSREYTCEQLKDVIREACLWQLAHDQDTRKEG